MDQMYTAIYLLVLWLLTIVTSAAMNGYYWFALISGYRVRVALSGLLFQKVILFFTLKTSSARRLVEPFHIVQSFNGLIIFTHLLACDGIHPARDESASMAYAAFWTVANQARRSWAKSIASDIHSLFHLRVLTTAVPMCRTRFSFSVAAQVFSCPPVRLRQVRGTSGLIIVEDWTVFLYTY